jgi:hypothetical protein
MSRSSLPSSSNRIRFKSSHRRLHLKTSHRRPPEVGEPLERDAERERYLAPPKRPRR